MGCAGSPHTLPCSLRGHGTPHRAPTSSDSLQSIAVNFATGARFSVFSWPVNKLCLPKRPSEHGISLSHSTVREAAAVSSTCLGRQLWYRHTNQLGLGYQLTHTAAFRVFYIAQHPTLLSPKLCQKLCPSFGVQRCTCFLTHISGWKQWFLKIWPMEYMHTLVA